MMFFKMALLSAAAAQASKKCKDQTTLKSVNIKAASHDRRYMANVLPDKSKVSCKNGYKMDKTDLIHVRCHNGSFMIKYQSKNEEALLDAVSPCKLNAVACKDETLTYGTVNTQQAAHYYTKKDFTTKNQLATVLTCTNGRKVNPKLTQISCLGEGKWMFEANKNPVDKEDLCIKDSVACPDETVTNGQVKTQQAEHFDKKAEFTKNSSTKLATVLLCNNGYERAAAVTKITCNGDGTWDFDSVQKKNLCVKKAVTTPKPTPATQKPVTTTTPKPTPVTECPDLPVANGKLLKQTPPTAAKKEYTLTDNTILKCNATFERKITKVTCDGATGTWFNGTNKIAKNAKDLCKKKNKKSGALKNKKSGALLVGTAAAAVLLL